MGLELSVSQVQTLSPQMIQSLSVLQMNAQELLDHIQELTLENPVLDLAAPAQEEQPHQDEAAQQMEWLASTDRQNSWCYRQDLKQEDRRDGEYGSLDGGGSLSEYVYSQLPSFTGDMDRAVKLLADLLDQNGWLSASLKEISNESGLSEPLLELALQQIQSVEPWGVGARDLKECLLIQLQHEPDTDDMAAEIVRDHLPALARSHYNAIAKALGATQEQVRKAAEQIRQLSPRPGNGFTTTEKTHYVIPDMIASEEYGRWTFRATSQVLPRLHINEYYVDLRGKSDDPTVLRYLDEKIAQAKWAITAIQQRENTMLRCMACIGDLQEDYFKTNGQGALRPMTLSDVAEQLDVSVSTVSRAIRGKYLQCPNGTVPLSFFFSSAAFQPDVGESSVSVMEAKRRLNSMIMQEDPKRPLSDQRLCDMMKEQGCPISRRTVAKYRSELGHPPATGRKRV